MKKTLIILISLALTITLFAGCFGRGGHSLNIDASEVSRIDGRIAPSVSQVTDIAEIEAIVNRLNTYRMVPPWGDMNIGGETPEIDLSIYGKQEWRIQIWGGGYIRFTDPNGTRHGMYRIIDGGNVVWEFWEEFGN